jgi:putative transcriptional regulator
MRRFRILMPIGFALTVLQAGQAIAGKSPLVPVAIDPEPSLSVPARPGPGMFLVARRSLGGTYFGKTVVYLVEHDDDGTLGLIVNRSSEIRLSDALPDLEKENATGHRLYYGGPVEPAMIMMLLRGASAARGTAHVAGSVYVATDHRALGAAIAAHKSASEMRLYIGYSGWSPGQLDFELQRGSWHVVPASADDVFSSESDSLWQRLIERLEPEGIEVRDEGRVIPAAAA